MIPSREGLRTIYKRRGILKRVDNEWGKNNGRKNEKAEEGRKEKVRIPHPIYHKPSAEEWPDITGKSQQEMLVAR